MTDNQLKINFKEKRDFKSWTFPKEGIIFSFTTINFPLEGYTNPPYYVALISLKDDSFKVTARINMKDDQKIEIGQSVQINATTFSESGELPVLIATPI
ncbi:MAG: OB-fold domain-containing protein [Candidatus Hodarchaeales archaeon]|jgi:uncharacterized OB-fold protein